MKVCRTDVFVFVLLKTCDIGDDVWLCHITIMYRHDLVTAPNSDLEFGRQQGEGKWRWSEEGVSRQDLEHGGNVPVNLISLSRLSAKILRYNLELKHYMDDEGWVPVHALCRLQEMRHIKLPDLHVVVKECCSKGRKTACQQLLDFQKAFTAYTVDDAGPIISSYPETIRQDFAEEWCTLFQVDAPKMGNVSAVGKGDSKKKRELAGAIATIASAWLVDKANGTEVLCTVEKEPCSDMMLTVWKANLKVSTAVWCHEKKTRINVRREAIAMCNIVRQRIQKQLCD